MNTIPRHRSEQLAELARMLGPVDPPQPLTSVQFIPVAGNIVELKSGALRWDEDAYPDNLDNPISLDATTLSVEVMHTLMYRRHSAHSARRFRNDVTRIRPNLGIHRVRVPVVPQHWTVTTIRDVARRMLALTPNDVVATADAEATFHVIVGGSEIDQRRPIIEVERPGVNYYSRLTFFPNACAALRDWIDLYGGEKGQSAVAFANIDTPKPISRANASKPPINIDEDTDDDADDIENVLILRTVQQFIQPAATWADISDWISTMRHALKNKYGSDKGEQ